MKIEIIVALISVSGVVLSGIVSWLVSAGRTRSEIKKLRFELQHTLIGELQKERLKHYPSIYKILAGFIAEIQTKRLIYSKLQTLEEGLSLWHTEYGYLLSAESNSRLYTFIRTIRKICESSEEAFLARIADDKKRRQLIRDSWVVELGLKNDLGIFAIEFFDPDRKFDSYTNVNKMLENEKG